MAIKDKETAQKLKESLYVDNSVTSVNTPEEYNKFKRDSVRILAEAKMELRQWEHNAIGLQDDGGMEDNCSSVLGMK